MEIVNSVMLTDYIIIALISSVVVEIIKRNANKKIDSLKSIAMVLGISVLLSVFHGWLIVNNGVFSGVIVMTAIEQGILCGAVAVFGFDLLKSLAISPKKKEELQYKEDCDQQPKE